MRVFLSVLIFVWSVSSLKAQEPLHLSLHDAVDLAAKQNLQVLAANKRVLQSMANISINKAALMPQVTGVFGGKRQTIDTRSSGIQFSGDPHIGPFNSFDARGELTLAIFDPEALARLRSARAAGRLSKAQTVKVKQDLLALVGAMYLEAKRAKENIDVNKITLQEAQMQFRVFETRFKQGLASESELQKAKVDLSRAEYSYESSLIRSKEKNLDLASALNLPLDQQIVFDEDYSELTKELQEATLSADVLVAQGQLEQTRAEALQTQRQLFPKVIAAGDYGREGESFERSSNTYSLGVMMKVPIWQGGETQAQIKQAQLKTQEDEILLQDAKSQSEVTLRKAKEHLVQAKLFVKSTNEEMLYNKYQLNIIQGLLKSGQANELDVVRYESIYAASLDQNLEAQAFFWTAKINLAHALGKIEEIFSANQEKQK